MMQQKILAGTSRPHRTKDVYFFTYFGGIHLGYILVGLLLYELIDT